MKYIKLYEELYTHDEIDSYISRFKNIISPLFKKYNIPMELFHGIEPGKYGITTPQLETINYESVPIFNKDNLTLYSVNDNYKGLFDPSKIDERATAEIGNVKIPENFVKIFEDLYITSVDIAVISLYEDKKISVNDVKKFAKTFYKDFPDHFIGFVSLLGDRHVGKNKELVEPLYNSYIELNNKVNQKRLDYGIKDNLENIKHFYEFLDDKRKEKYKGHLKGSDYGFFE